MKDPGLAAALDALVDPVTRGDRESPLRWTCKSTRQLAAALTAQGHPVSERTVAGLLHDAGYSLQANAKTTEGKQHPDRDGQFAHINDTVRGYRRSGDPVISVDTNKKELVAETPGYKNNGREWQPAGNPVTVGVHDFPDPAMPKAVPYGIYDLAADTGWVSVGQDGDTAAFSHITMNWRGRPLTSHRVVVDLICATTTRAGLTVHAEPNTETYPRGIKVTNAEMDAISPQLKAHAFHGDRNYTLRPRTTRM